MRRRAATGIVLALGVLGWGAAPALADPAIDFAPGTALTQRGPEQSGGKFSFARRSRPSPRRKNRHVRGGSNVEVDHNILRNALIAAGYTPTYSTSAVLVSAYRGGSQSNIGPEIAKALKDRRTPPRASGHRSNLAR